MSKLGGKLKERARTTGGKMHYFVVFRQLGYSGFLFPVMGVYLLHLAYTRAGEGNMTSMVILLLLAAVCILGPLGLRRQPSNGKVYFSLFRLFR